MVSSALPVAAKAHTSASGDEALRVVMRDDGGLLQMTGDVLELQAGREPELAADDRRRRQMLGVDRVAPELPSSATRRERRRTPVSG